MVYLKKIETRGFKSLGASSVSVSVEKGFVAITGPNGSGKSNLLDAILFALGENSAKTLRSQSLSSLIYDAAPEEDKPKTARVSLQFDNSDRGIPVDSDTVTISRELKATGESAYFLNGKHAPRNSLADLLGLALITSRGLNVVLQGMITHVSELIPDEKRRLVEQMVGVAQFDEKKEEAMKQLQEADSKLAVAMAKIEEIKDQVQKLEEQRNDQLRLRQLDDQIKWLRAVVASFKLANVLRTSLLCSESIDAKTKLLEELQLSLAETKTEEESAEAERNQLVRSALDSGAAQIQAEAGKIRADLTELRRQRIEALEQVVKFREIIPALEKMSVHQLERMSELESETTNLHEKIHEMEASRNKLVLERSMFEAERSGLHKKIIANQSRISGIRKLKDAHDSKINAITQNLNMSASKLRMEEEKAGSIRERIRFFRENIEVAQKSVGELESILDLEKRSAQELLISREKLEGAGRKVEAHLQAALLVLEKANTAVVKYDSDLESLQDFASENLALGRLESLGEIEVIDGYFGCLRKLLRYDSDYTEAIAALGKEWLEAVVVRDVQSLTRTAEVARKLKISRLILVPLSEVSDSEKAPAPLGVLNVTPISDLITCGRRFRGIVNFVFGDSFLVESNTEAFVLARKGFRAVTAKGDVFEPEVLAFETGYSRSYTRVSELLSQQRTFEVIKAALKGLGRLIEKRKGSLHDLRGKAEVYDEGLESHKLEISKTEMKLDQAKQNIAGYLQYSKSLETKIVETEHEIIRLSEAHEKQQRKMMALELGKKKILAILQALENVSFENELSEINTRRAALESSITAAESKVHDMTINFTRLRGDLENNVRPANERLREQKSQSVSTLELKTKTAAELEPRIRELESKMAFLAEEEARILEKAKRLKPMLDAVSGKLETLRAREESLQRSINSAQRDVDSARSDLGRLAESEGNLRGELQMIGYSKPVETFSGADVLLREVSTESESLRNNVNFLADQTYREIFENYKNSSIRQNELERERNAIVMFIERIDSDKRQVFIDAYDRINRELRQIFSQMTGGSAWLKLEKPDDIFSGGIFLMTQFPGQLPRDSGSVSGGQKTVSALAFIMAIQAVFPSPFYVFDEVDAALDNQYSGKMAEILSERASYSQIIVVSLKDVVVAKATSVIGVYMSQGSSKVIKYRNPMEVQVSAE